MRKTLAALSATAVLAGGCGGAGADGEGDPASAVPQDALFYAELVVRPEGSLREDALDAAGKVLLTDDPEAEIRRLMGLAFADTGEDFDFDRDVEPWLGERAAFWVRPSEAKDNFGALLLATTDAEEAETSLKASLERGGKTVAERSHNGTDYLVNSEEVAAGIVGDFAVIGREAEYKRTIDAFEGDSLAEADEYSDAIDALEDDRLAHFWADTAGLIEVARTQAGARADQLSALVPLDDLPPVAGSFAADGDRLAVEVKARGSKLGPLIGSGSTPLLQELPGDSWAAFGSADVGETLRDTVDGVAGALGGIVVRRELQREYGLDLDRDLLDWIGDVGVLRARPDALDARRRRRDPADRRGRGGRRLRQDRRRRPGRGRGASGADRRRRRGSGLRAQACALAVPDRDRARLRPRRDHRRRARPRRPRSVPATGSATPTCTRRPRSWWAWSRARCSRCRRCSR